MAIELLHKETLVELRASPGSSLIDVTDFARDHVPDWIATHVLIDFTHVDFSQVKSATIIALKSRMLAAVSIRAGLKTAFVCPDDLAFGMMRMYQMLMADDSGVLIEVFRRHHDAVGWLVSPHRARPHR